MAVDYGTTPADLLLSPNRPHHLKWWLNHAIWMRVKEEEHQRRQPPPNRSARDDDDDEDWERPPPRPRRRAPAHDPLIPVHDGPAGVLDASGRFRLARDLTWADDAPAAPVGTGWME